MLLLFLLAITICWRTMKTDSTSEAVNRKNLRRNRRIRWQLRAQAPFQFLAHFRDFHPRHHDELAAQHLVRFVLIRQLAAHTAILAILVPTEASIRYRFRTDELKAPQKRIPLRDLKLFPEHRDLHQLFIRTKGFRHDQSCSPRTGLRHRTTSPVRDTGPIATDLLTPQSNPQPRVRTTPRLARVPNLLRG